MINTLNNTGKFTCYHVKRGFYCRPVDAGPKSAPEMVYVTDEIFVKIRRRRCSAVRGNNDIRASRATQCRHSVPNRHLAPVEFNAATLMCRYRLGDTIEAYLCVPIRDVKIATNHLLRPSDTPSDTYITLSFPTQFWVHSFFEDRQQGRRQRNVVCGKSKPIKFFLPFSKKPLGI